MEYWITVHLFQSSIDVFQDELIFKGKIVYLMNLILEEDKHVLFRFSRRLEWCVLNLRFGGIISLDLMYNKEYNSYATFSLTHLTLKDKRSLADRVLGGLQNYRFVYE